MIEKSIPNNIVEYKPKFLFGLTGKQFVCVALTAVCILLDFIFLKPLIGDLAVVLAAVPAFLAACFGWGEKFTPGNTPFEKYLKTVFIQTFVAPHVRRVKTDSAMVIPCDKYYEPIPDSAVSPEVLSCVQEVRTALGITVEDETDGSIKTKKKATARPRYKKSRQACL